MRCDVRSATFIRSFVPVGMGDAASTHEVEQLYFVLEGRAGVLSAAAAYREKARADHHSADAPDRNVNRGSENELHLEMFMPILLPAGVDARRHAELRARRETSLGGRDPAHGHRVRAQSGLQVEHLPTRNRDSTPGTCAATVLRESGLVCTSRFDQFSTSSSRHAQRRSAGSARRRPARASMCPKVQAPAVEQELPEVSG